MVTTKLSDLRVLTDLGGFEPDDRYVRPGTRPAEVSDLVEALQAEGVGEVRRECDAHDDVAAWKNPDACRAGVAADDEAACVMGSVLVVPIPEDARRTEEET